MKKWDYIIISVLLIVFGAFVVLGLFKPKGQTLTVTYNLSDDGQTVSKTYSLNKDMTETIYLSDDKLQYVTVIVEDKSAYIDESSCPNKVCINSGKINKVNDCIVCVPLRFSMKIE